MMKSRQTRDELKQRTDLKKLWFKRLTITITKPKQHRSGKTFDFLKIQNMCFCSKMREL